MQSTVASNYKNIGLMTLILGVALLGFSVINAHGQAPWYGNGGYYGQQNGRWNRVSQNDLRKAYDKGYKQGEKAGKNDAKNNRGSYNRNIGYTNGGMRGGQLQRAYHDGYSRGYQDGYDRNVRYNRNRRYGNYGNRSIFGIPLPY
jgi:hypothetical protein